MLRGRVLRFVRVIATEWVHLILLLMGTSAGAFHDLHVAREILAPELTVIGTFHNAARAS